MLPAPHSCCSPFSSALDFSWSYSSCSPAKRAPAAETCSQTSIFLPKNIGHVFSEVDPCLSPIPVGGCLANNLKGWIVIGAEAWVLVLSEGYRIPFITTPPVNSHPVGFRSYPSRSVKAVALDQEVQPLLEKGALEEAPSTPGLYSHLFVVPKAMSVIRSHDWITAIDFKDAYLQILVHPDRRRFLRFIWKGLHYHFKVL